MLKSGALFLCIAVIVAGTSEAGDGVGQIDALQQSRAECIPVSVSGPQDSPGPGVAVVQTKVKPAKSRVYLDDRFIGRASLFDGRPGFLYLQPGSYRLELRYGGYRTEVVLLDVQEQPCRFNIKNRLERIQGEPKEHSSGPPVLMGGRIWGPAEPVAGSNLGRQNS